MRYLRAHWEWLLAAVLFLVCIYAAIFFAMTNALGRAGFALFYAWGIFQAAAAFADAEVMATGMHMRASREQGAEGLNRQ